MQADAGREELWLRAGEFVCGLVPAGERDALEAEVARDATFRAMVAEWERQMARLNLHYVAERAPDVWPFIDRSLFAARRRKAWLFRLAVLAFGVAVAGKVLLFWLVL